MVLVKNIDFIWKTTLKLESIFAFLEWIAGVAQLVEQLICNQLVGGSNPLTGSIKQLSVISCQ